MQSTALQKLEQIPNGWQPFGRRPKGWPYCHSRAGGNPFWSLGICLVFRALVLRSEATRQSQPVIRNTLHASLCTLLSAPVLSIVEGAKSRPVGAVRCPRYERPATKMTGRISNN